MRKLVLTEYSSTLMAFGDTALDEMYRRSKEKKERYVRPGGPVPERCPGCGKTAILTKGHYATLCEDCHASITYLAENTPW